MFHSRTVLLTASAILVGFSAHAGGVSGGGGNVLFPVDPQQPASRLEVRQVIVSAHRDVVQYLQEKQEQFRAGNLDPAQRVQFSQLFEQPLNVVEISRNKVLEIESERPCIDANGMPVDADIHADDQEKVCVSSFSISKKVEKGELSAQSAALLIHEFSELAGFDEDGAVQLQSMVLADFRRR